MEARRRVLGEGHPDTLTSMNNLAYALRDLGLTEKAKALFPHAANVSVQVLGDKHPLVVERKHQLDEWNDETLWQHNSHSSIDSLNNAASETDASSNSVVDDSSDDEDRGAFV